MKGSRRGLWKGCFLAPHDFRHWNKQTAKLYGLTCSDDAAEAWYNLSDLLDEQSRSEAAIDCLRSALRAAPDYADAMFNLAPFTARQQARRGRRVLAALSRQWMLNLNGRHGCVGP
jgi:tetratricopeptide (TPR) repeat protein